MDIYQFISSLVDSLIWPTVAIIFLFKFSDPLAKVVKSLARMKYKDFELDFGNELDSIESTVPELAFTTLDVNIEKEIEEVAVVSPMAAIPLTWSHVEAELSNVINRLAISPDYPAYNSALRNIELLKEHDYISIQDYNLLNELRKLRNSVAHNRVDPESVTVEKTLDYTKLAFGLIGRLLELERKPQ